MALFQAEGLESEVEKEVDGVIAELTAGLLEGAVDAPENVPEPEAQQVEVEEKEEPEAIRAMQARLESL